MSQEKLALMIFKGALSDLTAEEKSKVDAAKKAIESVVEESGDYGKTALIWTSLEIAAEE